MGSASKGTASGCTAEKVTVSRCSTHKEKGTHIFEIAGYSLKKGMGVDKFVRSAAFTVGGYDWSIRFYPDGTAESTEGCMALSLELMSPNAEVRAIFDFGIAKHSSGLLSTTFTQQTKTFSSRTKSTRQFTLFIVRSSYETKATTYLPNDLLLIKCEIGVIKESQLNETAGRSEIKVPPPDILEHLAKLLEAKEEADVTFSIGGETFVAHKVVLAMRSPVFKAELFGPMRETRTAPSRDDKYEMIRHLLVAADRYAVDRLKVLCQNILGKNLDVENVATTLALADQHNCDKLKDVCLQFLASSDKMDDVAATQGYESLKRSCPSVLIDALEKRRRSREA
ncbi:hypothetical protein ACQ4PT_054643 [Festuca glaucescens]